jgi:hypothetical protein
MIDLATIDYELRFLFNNNPGRKTILIRFNNYGALLGMVPDLR